MKKCLFVLFLISVSSLALAEPVSSSVYSIVSTEGRLQIPGNEKHSLLINGSDQLDCDLEHIRTYDARGSFITHIYFRNKEQCLKVEKCLEQGGVSTSSPIILKINTNNKVRSLNGLTLPVSCNG